MIQISCQMKRTNANTLESKRTTTKETSVKATIFQFHLKELIRFSRQKNVFPAEAVIKSLQAQ